MNEIQIIQSKGEIVFENGITKEFLILYRLHYEVSIASDTDVKIFINLFHSQTENLNYLQQNLDSVKELKISNDELINSILKCRDDNQRERNFLIEILPEHTFKILEPFSREEKPFILKLKKTRF